MKKLFSILSLSTSVLAISACCAQSTVQTQVTSQLERTVSQTESEKLAEYFAGMFEQDLNVYHKGKAT